MVVAGAEESSGGRTVVVGVKLDSYSRELLTWALVKVAQAGDRVIALHVLKNNEIVDRDGKSSLLSLVKAFDSILEVYEGFCNLKQVDLKLKICRGSSIQKILVREAKSYYASEVIVGTAQTHHTIRSSASVAKYCAKKLSKDCSVLAVNNGKIVFHRDANLASRISVKELENNRRNGLLNALQRSFSKNIKVLNDGSPIRPMLTWDDGSSCGKMINYWSGRQTTGVFPQDVWHSEICNRKPGRGFEATAEVLPRLFKIKYESSTLEELLYVDMPREYQNSSGQIVLDYAKAIQESVFEQLRVVRDGQLRIVFSPYLKCSNWSRVWSY